MRRLKLGLNIFICLILIGIIGKAVSAEERSIYIGDLVTIEVNTKASDEDAIRKAFDSFEIVDLKETDSGYLITVRTFEPGDKKVVIGNQEITISVKSTLDDINRTDIYEGDMTPRTGHIPIKWLWIYIAVLIVFVFSGIYYLIKRLKIKKEKAKTPYERFIFGLENINPASEFSLVEMTTVFKNYIGELFDKKIIGKTSDEIMSELDSVEKINPLKEVIRDWLKTCDEYKFSRNSADVIEKNKMLQKLKDIGEQIRKVGEVEA